TDVPEVILIPFKQPITARAGDDVTLPCRCEPAVDLTPLTVEWWQVELKTHPSRYLENGATVYVYTKHGGEMKNRKSPKRMELFPDQLRTGNASLTLRHVSLSDNGKYTCVIPDLKTEESLRTGMILVLFLFLPVMVLSVFYGHTFLGVTLDHKISWKPHIIQIKTKVAKILAIMNKSKYISLITKLYILYTVHLSFPI
uniref:Ig-like domain-containing protein n=1 Tax=Neogobius melanostomus TaxID=47308 RepID=A0A8C6WXL7_9GOBI